MFPGIMLEASPWRDEWEDTQREQFLKAIRFILPLVGSIYVGHYYFFDKPAGLEPLDRWFAFRMSFAAASICAYVFYLSPLANRSWYHLPALSFCAIICFSQALVTLYYAEAPWLYPYLFVFVSVLILRMTPAQSLVFAAVVIAISTPVLVEAGIDFGTLISASLITIAMSVVSRSSYHFELDNFLLHKKMASREQENLNLQREFSDRIRSFIPREIADRIQSLVDRTHASVLEASIEVLQPKTTDVACLYSDIRGFTQGSKDLDRFVGESVIPEVKASSRAIEQFRGIPRKIGDLIFAYFDYESPAINVLRATLAGIALARLNEDMNATVSSIDINRYILISSGPALVGNVGGLDSSVEITALGSPVNFLSRLDEATKQHGFSKRLSRGDILLCERSAGLLGQLELEFDWDTIDFASIGVEIRDFPEAKRIYSLKPSHRNWEQANAAYDCLEGVLKTGISANLRARPRSS